MVRGDRANVFSLKPCLQSSLDDDGDDGKEQFCVCQPKRGKKIDLAVLIVSAQMAEFQKKCQECGWRVDGSLFGTKTVFSNVSVLVLSWLK